MDREWTEIFGKEGYRFYRMAPEETTAFYKYYEEGFHVVLVAEMQRERPLSAERLHEIQERAQWMFYHPQGVLQDFPDGFPVYHVELLTVLRAWDMDAARRLCAQCSNTWVYDAGRGQLVIYEDQPGDFWGLRARLENMAAPVSRRNWKNYFYNFPFITALIAAVNIIVYLVLAFGGSTESGSYMASRGAMYPDFLTYGHQWWRLVTAMFVHFGVAHLANNMVIFCCVGSRLEKVAGHGKMLAIYFASGIGGGLLSYLVMMVSGDYAVSGGASGAVFGVIGALLWAVIYHKGNIEGMTVRGMALMLVLSLYFGFTTAGVDNWCHVGGLVCGFFMSMILYHGKR